MNRKKIVFAIPSLESGGMERVMSEIITSFSSIPNLECHLIIYGKVCKDFYTIPENVKIYKPDFNFNETKRFLSTLQTMYFLRRTVRKIRPNFLLSFGEYWNNFVLLSIIGLRIPSYVSDRSSPNISLGRFHNFLRKSLYRNAKGIIVQTTTAKEIFKTKFKNKNIKVIGNPIRSVSTDAFVKRENIIISVGRLITTKNFNQLINIFSSINNNNWKLIIVGGDSNKQNNSISLQKQINDLGMSESIILAGIKKNVEAYLLKAKIFAFTSSSEGFPNVIGEAMSAGLPVVAYDCIAGPSDMIENGKDGFLIPLFDEVMFEEKLRFLMENDTTRESMGTNARESIKRFSVEDIGREYYDFIVK